MPATRQRVVTHYARIKQAILASAEVISKFATHNRTEVLNEVRIRAVEWDCDCEAACSDGDRDSGKRRLVPPFIVTCSTDGSTFAPPIVTHGGTATGMEARALVLRNAPRRRLARDEPRRTAGPASRGALGAGRPPGLRRPVVIDRARPA